MDPRSYDTIREIILGIMKYKLQEYYDESSLSDKINVVKRSLNRTGISVSEREIERALNEDADERASRQAVLGIFLALSIHHFGYDPEKRYQSATTDIENAISGVRKEDTIRKWLKIAAAEVVRH